MKPERAALYYSLFVSDDQSPADVNIMQDIVTLVCL